MRDIITPEIFEKCPEYVRGVVIARGVDNHGEHDELVDMMRRVETAAAQDASLQEIKKHPRLAPWRQVYTDFGVNPNKFYSSIESLARRGRRGDQLSYINTLVCLFNYFSLKHIVPSGGDDLVSVDGDLHLTLAKGDEPFVPFNGTETEYPDPGEVIYVDNSRVMCRRWNWRQGDQTKLTPETSNVAINVDCLPPVSPEEAAGITRELAGLVEKFCGGRTTCVMLDKDHPEAEV
jgi:DNA/RNA-binding domain of Phe-tRNA-synthetase-like protein